MTPCISRARGIRIAARHLHADEVRKILGVVLHVLARLLNDLTLLDGIGRRFLHVGGLGRRRWSRFREALRGRAQFLQYSDCLRSRALALQILDGLVVQLFPHLDMLQIFGNLPIRLLEVVDSGMNEFHQLIDGEAHLRGRGESHGGHQVKNPLIISLCLRSSSARTCARRVRMCERQAFARVRTRHARVRALLPRRRRAGPSFGYWNSKPAFCAASGMTRWLASSIPAISPNRSFSASLGTGKIAGR